MSVLPCCSATNAVRRNKNSYHEGHTCGMPEVDYKSQDDHCERREVEPVRLEVLERSQDKSEEKKTAGVRTKRKSPIDAGQAQSSNESTIERLPKSRP